MIGLLEAIGRSVVARDTAESIGSVSGAVVDAGTRRIVAVQIGRGRKGRLVDWASITGMGPDAVVVDGEAAIREPANDREHAVVKGDVPLLGARVLSTQGDLVGALDDVELDEVTGDILTVVSGENRLPATALRSIGAYAVVVDLG